MQCVILAGGLGTRMWPRAATIPKTLLPVCGRPFADLQLEWLYRQGIRDVVYCVGYLGEQVCDHVGDGSRYGLRARYVSEGDRLRGTAGALRLAAEQGALDEEFLVLFGDSYLDIDVAAVVAAFTRADADGLMTVYRNDNAHDRSNVVYAAGRVLRYEKGLQPPPPQMCWIDYGLSVVRRSFIEGAVAAGAVADLAPLMTRLAAAGKLAGFPAQQRFYEIGSPDGLAALERRLASSSHVS